MTRIALIGYGEVGRILGEDLRARGESVVAFDLKLADARGHALREHALSHCITLAGSHADAVRGAELIVSAVTASQAVPVAQACASGIERGAFFLDFNSASPGAKCRAAEAINAAGGRYVEGAVMTSVPPYRIKVPLLLGGPDAAALEPLLASLGFAPKVASEKLGVASATKMCRSVMIKGLEAMVIESFTAARFYGVEDAVLASLHETFPGIDWEKQGAYFFSRVVQHVQRRAEEHGYATFVVDSGRGGGREEEAAQVLYRHGVDGVVAVLDARPKIVSEPLFPIVVIDRHVQGLDSIQADHKAGGRLMAEHAVSLGHRKVGLLSGNQDLSSSRQRREGFLEAALGRLEIRWNVEIPLTADLPEQALRAIAARDVTLIACVNDLVAMGALGALKNERLHVPDDVCVIGFDDMQWARWPLTDLTTVHQPLTELGARAVDLLLRRLDDPSREIESVTLPVNLVKRGSTRQIEL